MGVRFPSATNALPVVGQTITTTTETALMTVGPFSPSVDGAIVFLFWHALVLLGTGTTGAILRIRRGSGIAGQVVQATVTTITATAGAVTQFNGCYADAPGNIAAFQYTATIVQVGATANGTFNDGSLLALSL